MIRWPLRFLYRRGRLSTVSTTTSTTRIWIARHGQTEANRSGLFCGQSETRLTDTGRDQARALGARLKDTKIVAAYASDLARAIDTATFALDGRGIAIQLDPDLRELHYGDWEMRRESAISKSHPDEFKRMRDEDPAWQPPGGETTGIVRARTFAALGRIAGLHKGQDVLLVGHGTAINCMLSEVLGIAPTHVFRFDVANCGLSQVAVVGGRMVVVTLNETTHLNGKAVVHT